MQYNKEHGITPETIVKGIQKKIVPVQVEEGKKLAAAEELDFENATKLRARVEEIKEVYGD